MWAEHNDFQSNVWQNKAKSKTKEKKQAANTTAMMCTTIKQTTDWMSDCQLVLTGPSQIVVIAQLLFVAATIAALIFDFNLVFSVIYV